MTLKKHIGAKVQAARRRKGLTQEELAESIGRAVETISNIERGFALTGLDTLEKISHALGEPIKGFFDGYQPERKVHLRRQKREQQLLEKIDKLNDRELKLAISLIDSVVNQNRR